MKKNRFYKTSPHGHVGTNVSFHSKLRDGYTTNIDNAQLFTREQAQSDVDCGRRRFEKTEELFLSADDVDELTVLKVDHQYISQTYPENKDPNDEYVIYRKNCWDGNDLGFAYGASHNFDYSKARVFSESELESIDCYDWIAVPKSHCDEFARPTFQYSKIDRRAMIVCAGITGISEK
ncbi:hypothetical protein [Photobacterium damselae]|uniref:hypothetical protein n=1 Tax=Photobacterium damselae TaxID=38293 RepID=UPI001F45A97E|nr:hypothetical protein [Photobacterium damselae]UKA04977.1 hypothetical protein IHC89_22285 [Photobacterium damselae subsp. damselae]